MKKLISILASILLLSSNGFAGDYHQDTQGHLVTYTILTNSGDIVTGQTPKVALYNANTGLYLDFSDNTFKAPTSATTLYQTMSFNQTGGFYFRVVTVDQATLVSGDYVCIVSNDDSTYKDKQSESVNFDNLNNLIKIHR